MPPVMSSSLGRTSWQMGRGRLGFKAGCLLSAHGGAHRASVTCQVPTLVHRQSTEEERKSTEDSSTLYSAGSTQRSKLHRACGGLSTQRPDLPLVSRVTLSVWLNPSVPQFPGSKVEMQELTL